MHFDVLVVGGGAAGLFCARTAALRGRRVGVLEHNPRPGNKILISGGGRCNFTNTGASFANYVTHGSPHFTKSALARFAPKDFLTLVERHGIAWHEKKLGQLFCDQSSKQILNMLESECSDLGVEIRLNCRIQSVDRERDSHENTTNGYWHLITSTGPLTSSSLIVATGGLSFPKLGATPWGYEVAKRFDIKVIPPRPGLVPLTFNPKDLADFGELSGLSIEAILSANPKSPSFQENVLFTHRGLSGPAILQISSHWEVGKKLHINLMPGQSAFECLDTGRRSGRELKTILRSYMPERLVSAWCRRHAPARPLGQLPDRDLRDLAQQIHSWEFTPAGDEGYPKAEVTVGGISTAELSSKTMECRKIPGLFFIGEVVDITGWLGGYNFQWAWASGYAAGNHA